MTQTARRRFHIVIVRPEGYPHSDCFHEVADGIESGLRQLGHWVTRGENHVDPAATAILFGAHLLSEQSARGLPASAVVYNLEQLSSSNELPDWYMGLAARCRIWDYSPLHLNVWRSVPCLFPPALVEIGFAPELQRIVSDPDPGIDVLFYGSYTSRRAHIVEGLRAAGLKVHTVFGVYGAERDALIASSKVMLNVHARESGAFEIVRVSYLLANAKAVVTEDSEDLGSLADAVAVAPYDEVANCCIRLVRDDAARHALERRALQVFSQRRQADLLEPVVGRGEVRHAQSVFSPSAIPVGDYGVTAGRGQSVRNIQSRWLRKDGRQD